MTTLSERISITAILFEEREAKKMTVAEFLEWRLAGAKESHPHALCIVAVGGSPIHDSPVGIDDAEKLIEDLREIARHVNETSEALQIAFGGASQVPMRAAGQAILGKIRNAGCPDVRRNKELTLVTAQILMHAIIGKFDLDDSELLREMRLCVSGLRSRPSTSASGK